MRSGVMALKIVLASSATFAVLMLSSVSALAASAPTIVSQPGGGVGTWSAEVGYTTATIKAEINPNEAATTYRFEYGTTTSYGASAPEPGGQIGSGTEGVEVSQHLTNIQAGTTYHYRVIATNAEGTVNSPDETFVTFPPVGKEIAEVCPNDRFRVGLSANLPDCRAYELVSPVNKNGADVNAQDYNEFTSAESGERVQFATRTGLGETEGSGFGGYRQYIAARGIDGWQSHGITPTPARSAPLMVFVGATLAPLFSSELERALVVGYSLPGVAGAVPERENLYLEDVLTGQLVEPLTRFEGPEEAVPTYSVSAGYGGGSKDLSVVAFQSSFNLAPPASGRVTKVFALDKGLVYLVGLLPGNAVPPGGSVLATRFSNLSHAINISSVSGDGSRIFFFSPIRGRSRQLYMRRNESETVKVSESETATPVEAENVSFQGATPDGKKVLFTTETQLSPEDTGGPGVRLYMYTDSAHPESESNLTYIAQVTGGNTGEVVKGVSEDGSHIYFTDSSSGEGLYLWHNGTVLRVSNQSFDSHEEARVSRDGRRIAFMNRRAQTVDSSEIDTLVDGTYNSELYVYDENANKLTCVSCPPSGARPTSGIELTVGATNPSNPGFAVTEQPRFFSEDGKYAFFNTTESLLPQDTNGLTDAYEYDVETGKLSLLSPGTGDTGIWFVDASASGGDAFLATRQKLTGWDPDKLSDVYDARVEGGFAEPPAPSVPCQGDECQGTPSAAPNFDTASGFNGLGNAALRSPATVTTKKLTHAQQLLVALKHCRAKRPRRVQRKCERTVRRRYATKSSAKRVSRRAGR